MSVTVEFKPVGAEAVERWARQARDDIATAVAAGAPSAGFAYERQLLNELRMYVFRGAEAFVSGAASGPRCLIIAGFHRRSLRGWGRYVSVWAVHTRHHDRGRGAALTAYRALARHARLRGAARLITTAGSYGGWRTHRTLGWDAWGTNKHGEIVSDAALLPETPHDTTAVRSRPVPPLSAKLTGPGRPLTPPEHAAILTDPTGPYRVPATELPAPYRVVTS